MQLYYCISRILKNLLNSNYSTYCFFNPSHLNDIAAEIIYISEYQGLLTRIFNNTILWF